ncbi:unnamed protein product [Rotaria magnacalcarata]|uniref:C-type lectin domain-containing protein n=2 Tax=Rotaria magnacalcarata TaxID=392030 RepID=A0A819RST9_9BILA|nr:unnamed protein product [Rotaria magnacalcarata]
MLSSSIRFLLQFIFTIHCIVNLIFADNVSPPPNNQCQSDWYYLPEETKCITFTTSQTGDVSWYNSYKACQTSSAQLLTLPDSITFQSIQNKLTELENDDEIYFDYIQRGSWIGNAKWSNDNLCDSASTTIEDLQLNCIILTVRSNDQTLCLKRVSCIENHPFICQKRAMTEREFIESTMERWNFWKCFIPIWCVIDHVQEKKKAEKKRQQALLAAAQAQELQDYLNQFNFELPEELQFIDEEPDSLETLGDESILSGVGTQGWAILIAGGFITLLMMCTCCTALIFTYRFVKQRRLRQNPAYRDGIRAFNETCTSDEPSCPEPLQCFNGYCLCSKIGKTTEPKTSIAFWTGEECIVCPMHYVTSGTKCVKLILGESNQLAWDPARELCQKDGGDLFVIREDHEFEFVADFIRSNIKDIEMIQRTPQNGTRFASIWIGARFTNWSRVGTYDIVSHGPLLTTSSPYWCKQGSLLGSEPNYIGLKETGERQACVGLACFKDSSVCLHDWFCSWKTYILCELHPPPPKTTTMMNNTSEEILSIHGFISVSVVH